MVPFVSNSKSSVIERQTLGPKIFFQYDFFKGDFKCPNQQVAATAVALANF